MRRAAALIASALVVTGLAASEAAAQPRQPRQITVTPRSYLDPGKVVPAGSLSNYVHMGQTFASPVYSNVAERFGEASLPPRIGGGRNPFGPVDYRAPDFLMR
ncbi:hypothetical protein QNA08_15880 [Chelatococcus sp. SYSU_G07232]|uniref:Uncharacterized protein n=1 Tax=Chelatococcus albus TaxID=3047466 RepID=A0ABT7AK08_9HYPH|nr:hypothetical protein [Chelatococcus sp. SYSU_G07232]MDJ1159704.1 hypothetical protein [Chelatococcus sp. SYSU_G07232]